MYFPACVKMEEFIVVSLSDNLDSFTIILLLNIFLNDVRIATALMWVT